MREGKKKALYLRLASDKMLYLSSGAAEHLSDRADLYQRGGVTALVSAADGQYHLCHKSTSCQGKNLCCAELIAWLGEKYALTVGARLSAWTPRTGAGVIFFGDSITSEEATYDFDRQFLRLNLTYHKRYGDRVFVEDNCVSFTSGLRQWLPQRMGLYCAGSALALLGESGGPYRVEYRGSRKHEAVYSAQLANYCREAFGSNGRSVLLLARPIKNGLIFGTSESALNASPSRRLDLGASEDCFIRPQKNGSLYFSAKAAEQLGTRFSLYTAGDLPALRGDEEGSLSLRRNGYQNLLHSAVIRHLLSTAYPGCERLYLTEKCDLLALSPRPDGGGLPPRSAYHPAAQIKGRGNNSL